MENVSLDGGLDLVRARPAVLPGRIRQCLNYEVGWQRGYSRIDGWERFDGNVSPSATDYWVVVLPTDLITGDEPVADKPTRLYWHFNDESGSAGQMVDYVSQPSVGGDISSFSIVYRTGRLRPAWGSTLSDSATPGEENWSFVLDQNTTSVYTLSQVHTEHEDFLGTLSTYAELLRDVVKPVPGGGTIVGLHYHEDQLYAIRDTAEVTLSTEDVSLLAVGMHVYNTSGQLGEIISVDTVTGVVNIIALTAEGFLLEAGQTFKVALTIRFVDGSGEFNESDAVTFAPSGWAGDVGLVERRDGSFGSDSALGVGIFIHGPESIAEAGDVVTNNTVTGSMVVDSIMFPALDADLTVVSASSKSDVAAMWRSTDFGWEAATSGRLLGFNTGTTDPLSTAPVPVTVTRFPGLVELAASGVRDPWGGSLDNLKATDGATIDWTEFTYSSNVIVSDTLAVSDFKLGLTDKLTILGMSLKLVAQGPVPATSSFFSGTSGAFEATLISGPTSKPSLQRSIGVGDADPALRDYFIGDETSNWLVGSNPTIEEMNAAEFGFNIHFSGNGAAAAVWDSVEVQVHAESVPGSTLYLHDPTSTPPADIGTISVDSLKLSSGAWDGTGEGVLRLDDWTTTVVPVGTEIWTEPGGAGGTGALVAVVSAPLTSTLLPGSKLLDENFSKYQMISYNYYATEEQNAIYGVNGAGPAFWYDGKTLDFIFTGVDVDVDKPRHLAPHLYRLALGYKWGEVYVSEPGEPTEFDGVDFASTFGFGDKITGLMPTAGDVLAVFTESSTWALSGAAGDSANPPQQNIINHKVGAIEYTVQNIGGRPIFASFRGIETLETMDQYSDFFTAPLTYDVSPWLLRRLQSAAGIETTDESVVNSVVVRNKNQYRLFFADGYLLTLTYVGPEKEPQCTIQKYWFNSDKTQFARIFATASGVSSRGQDRAFFSVEERPDRPRAAIVASPETDFVYELDRGRSFDGGTIEAHFTLTHNFGQQQQSPMLNKRYNVIHIHGTVPGYASLRMARSLNYEQLYDPVLPYEDVYFGALSAPPEDEPRPKYAKARLTARGFAVSLHITHTSAVEFPHNIQLVTFLDDNPTKPNR